MKDVSSVPPSRRPCRLGDDPVGRMMITIVTIKGIVMLSIAYYIYIYVYMYITIVSIVYYNML